MKRSTIGIILIIVMTVILMASCGLVRDARKGCDNNQGIVGVGSGKYRS